MESRQIEWRNFMNQYSTYFENYETVWQRNYQDLVHYIELYNQLPRKHLERRLYQFLCLNKKKFRNNTMRNEEQKLKWEELLHRFPDIFPDTNAENNSWMEELNALQLFIDQNGRLPRIIIRWYRKKFTSFFSSSNTKIRTLYKQYTLRIYLLFNLFYHSFNKSLIRV